MKIIELTKGKQAKVDDDMFDLLSKYKWHTLHIPGHDLFYAVRSQSIGKGN